MNRSPSTKYKLKTTFKHCIWVSRSNLHFRGISHKRHDLVLQYPVSIPPLNAVSTITIDDAASVKLKVNSISKTPLGVLTEGTRILRFRAFPFIDKSVDNCVSQKEMFFICGDIPYENEYIHDIGFLPGKETYHFEFSVRFDPAVPPFSVICLAIDLEIGNVGDYSQPMMIQQQRTIIQLSGSYIHNPAAKSLLVWNDKISQDIYTYFMKELEKATGAPVSNYNISLYGGLDLLKERADSRCLVDDFAAGGLICVLNNPCSTAISANKATPFPDLMDLWFCSLKSAFDIRVVLCMPPGTDKPALPPSMSTDFCLDYITAGNRVETCYFDQLDEFATYGMDRILYRELQEKKAVKLKSKIPSSSLYLYKPATVDVGAVFTLKVKQDSKLSPYKERFAVLRRNDQSISWYLNSTDNEPEGILFYSIPMDIVSFCLPQL